MAPTAKSLEDGLPAYTAVPTDAATGGLEQRVEELQAAVDALQAERQERGEKLRRLFRGVAVVLFVWWFAVPVFARVVVGLTEYRRGHMHGHMHHGQAPVIEPFPVPAPDSAVSSPPSSPLGSLFDVPKPSKCVDAPVIGRESVEREASQPARKDGLRSNPIFEYAKGSAPAPQPARKERRHAMHGHTLDAKKPAAAGLRAAAPEHAYDVLHKTDSFEIRLYRNLSLASTTAASGSPARPPRELFGRLYSYISGSNLVNGHNNDNNCWKIPMYAPVYTQEEDDGSTWMAFTLPPMPSLPAPTDSAVESHTVPQWTVAVSKLGSVSPAAFTEAVEKLRKDVKEGWAVYPDAKGQLARYDPPWVPGMWQRNEVMLPVYRSNK